MTIGEIWSVRQALIILMAISPRLAIRIFSKYVFLPFYKGILPCFFLGIDSRLVSSVHKASTNLGRVSEGKMISSIKPVSAALYKLVISLYSEINSFVKDSGLSEFFNWFL